MRQIVLRQRLACTVAFAISVMVFSIPEAAIAECSDWPAPGVDWTKCRKTSKVMKSIDFTNAILEETNFYGSNLANGIFLGANLFKAELSSARLSGAKLDGVDMRKSVGYRAKFDRASLKGAQMEKSEFSRAFFVATDLSDANLIKSEFGRVDFEHANLDRTKFNYANLSRALLSGASMVGSDFTKAITYFSKIEGADLSAVIGLTQGQLDDACGDDTTQLPAGLVASPNWPCID